MTESDVTVLVFGIAFMVLIVAPIVMAIWLGVKTGNKIHRGWNRGIDLIDRRWEAEHGKK